MIFFVLRLFFKRIYFFRNSFIRTSRYANKIFRKQIYWKLFGERNRCSSKIICTRVFDYLITIYLFNEHSINCWRAPLFEKDKILCYFSRISGIADDAKRWLKVALVSYSRKKPVWFRTVTITADYDVERKPIADL